MVKPDGSINLAVFGCGDFTEFVLYKYMNVGVSLSTLSGYRSSLKDYYTTQIVALPAGFTTNATAIYSKGFGVFVQARFRPAQSNQAATQAPPISITMQDEFDET
ncbi:hypothetical protein H257_11927 [Aphanomyces astaci]|uniref:Uncharacterized protein n=1 Tax=Aphanomyces astaci TaxID=112090 RepID=W4G2F9_APHAT|nr:hypothetical protein H257_11927 [Aphanomyces astaci]ETV73103.1 hypothetical protein H257_11927 [Aphanomyces astaci]|eukprot:XP_009837308.1 hypothetical protein H257_11927 [Aphanomyces astaci]